MTDISRAAVEEHFGAMLNLYPGSQMALIAREKAKALLDRVDALDAELTRIKMHSYFEEQT